MKTKRERNKQLNSTLHQIDFTDVEMRAISKAVKDGDWPLIVKIIKTTSSGSSYSADCPNCGKTKILSGELNTMTAVCDKCYTPFKLESK